MNLLTTVAVVLLVISALLLFQTYIGFYLSLLLFVRRSRETGQTVNDDQLPTCAVIVPAYNEEKLIGTQLDNLLAQDYPRDKLRIIVGSDQSTDCTDDIVRSYADRGVQLYVMPERGGKSKILDTLVPQLDSEIVTVIDANVVCNPDALRRIGERYVNPKVGCVGGRIILKPPQGAKNVELESSYRDYEIALKRMMSYLGVVVGMHGGLYSFRQKVYCPLHRETPLGHDDIIIPLDIMGQGYRIEFADDAISYEETNASIQGEYRRRVRMAAFNLNSISPVLKQSCRAGFIASYTAVTYKIFRWLSPFLWGLVALLSFALICVHPVFTVLSALIALGLILALVGWILDRYGKKAPLATACYHFAAMNIASYMGLKIWFTGVKSYWTPRS